MIKERMIELLVLLRILENLNTKNKTGIIRDNETDYNFAKMVNRAEVLMKEFLEPYVIESSSKE